MKVLPLFACVLLAGCSSPSSSLLTGPSAVSPEGAAVAAGNASAASGNLEIAFTKWITTPSAAMEGVAALGSNVGTYTGQVNEFDDFGNGLSQIQATYAFQVAGIEFSAEIAGHQNKAGRGVLNGTITEGAYTGARVHVTFQATPAAECAEASEVPGAKGGIDGFCYIGTIKVMTRTSM
jgi:hypothetical protein